MSRGPKRASGERSNLYSRSKCSNWARYSPYDVDFVGFGQQPEKYFQPHKVDGLDFTIYTQPPHRDFVQPVTVDDVAQVLRSVPPRYRKSLGGVFLPGGTRNQAKAFHSRLFRYGCYYYVHGYIYLYPFPRARLEFTWRGGVRPHIRQEYERSGATVVCQRRTTTITFDQTSLRWFYLYDVLLHEIGHHVDSRAHCRPTGDAERFAEWFVQEQARRRNERAENTGIVLRE